MRRPRPVHRPDTAHEPDSKHQPRVRSHESETPPIHVQSAGCDADDTDAEPRVHKRVVQVAALEVRHAAILAGLPVEDEVDAEEGGAEDAGAVEEALSQVALGDGVVRCLLVGATECGAEAEGIVCGGEGGRLGGEEVGVALERCVVECADEVGGGLLGDCLAEGCGDGEGPSEGEGHGGVCDVSSGAGSRAVDMQSMTCG